MSTSQPFAVFDIDGTVMRWQFFHAISDALTKHGLIDPAVYQPVRQARMTWKRRSSDGSYRAYEDLLVNTYAQGLRGISAAQYNTVVGEVFETYKDQVYLFTRDLIRELKAKNYLLFAISGSPAEAVNKFGEYYGFDDFVGVQQEQVGGKLTGKIAYNFDKKQSILQTMIDKHQATTTGSIGVGDSKSDIAMLALTERPLAFNPDKELLEHAKAHGWRVALERKSVVYQLEPQHGTYVLV